MSNTWQIQNTLDDYTNKEGNVTTSDSSIAILLSKYVLKEDGKGLSSNDFTDEDYNKLHSIECCAQVNKLETLTINCGDKIYPTSDKNINIPIPTKTSDLINDSFAKLINQSTESDYSDSYVGKSKVAFQDEENIAIGKNADVSCGGIALGKNTSTSDTYDVNIADKLKHNSTTDIWEGTISTSEVAITNSNGTDLNELDTKFTKVSELPSYIEEDTVVVYVGDDTEDLVSGGIYKGVPKLTTYLNYTDEETNLYFDLSTLESTSVSGVLKNQSSYNATNFSDGDGRNDILLYYMIDSDTQIAKIYAYYSDNEIYEINSINWNTKSLTVGDSVEIGEGELLNQGSVSMITYSQAEWSDVSTAVEEVSSLPQALKNKIYNKTSSSTYSSGSSCYNSIESLYENFPKSISKLSEGSSGNYTHTYLIQSGNLSYNGVKVTKIIVNVSSSTNSYLYDGDTELVYLSDDVLVYDLIYTKMEVYSKDVQLATYDDIGFEDPATAVERDNNKSITSDAVSCYDGEVVINVSCSEYPITNLGDDTIVHGSMCVQNNVTIENNLTTSNINDCCGGGLLLNNPSRMSDCCSYTPRGSLVDGKPIVYNCTDDTIETSDTLSIDSLNASTMSVCKAYVKELDTVKEETISSTGNHIVLRANNDSSMVSGETSGILIHNYDGCGKDVAIVSDNFGVVKVGTGTPTDTTYPTLYFNKCDNKYYTDITDSSTLISPSGAMTEWASVENTDDYTKWTNAIFSEIDFTRISERNTYIVVGSEYFDTTASQTTTSGTEESSETVTTISDDTDLYNLADYSTVGMYLYNSTLYALLYDGSTKIAIEINGITDDGYYDGNANQDDTLYDTIESDGTLLLSDAFGEIAEYIVTESSLEPLTTRADSVDMNDRGLTKWNSDGNKIDTISVPSCSNQALTSVVQNGVVSYQWSDTSSFTRDVIDITCCSKVGTCYPLMLSDPSNPTELLRFSCSCNCGITAGLAQGPNGEDRVFCVNACGGEYQALLSLSCESSTLYSRCGTSNCSCISTSSSCSHMRSCCSTSGSATVSTCACLASICSNTTNNCCVANLSVTPNCFCVCVCNKCNNCYGSIAVGTLTANIQTNGGASVVASGDSAFMEADFVCGYSYCCACLFSGDDDCKLTGVYLNGCNTCSQLVTSQNTANKCCYSISTVSQNASSLCCSTLNANTINIVCDDVVCTGLESVSCNIATSAYAKLYFYCCCECSSEIYANCVVVGKNGTCITNDNSTWCFTDTLDATLPNGCFSVGDCICHRYTCNNVGSCTILGCSCGNTLCTYTLDSNSCVRCKTYICTTSGQITEYVCACDGIVGISHCASIGPIWATMGVHSDEGNSYGCMIADCVYICGYCEIRLGGCICSALRVCGCLYANFPSVTWSIDPTTWCVSYS